MQNTIEELEREEKIMAEKGNAGKIQSRGRAATAQRYISLLARKLSAFGQIAIPAQAISDNRKSR